MCATAAAASSSLCSTFLCAPPSLTPSYVCIHFFPYCSRNLRDEIRPTTNAGNFQLPLLLLLLSAYTFIFHKKGAASANNCFASVRCRVANAFPAPTHPDSAEKWRVKLLGARVLFLCSCGQLFAPRALPQIYIYRETERERRSLVAGVNAQ